MSKFFQNLTIIYALYFNEIWPVEDLNEIIKMKKKNQKTPIIYKVMIV